MKFEGILLVSKDLQRTKAFYKEVFGLRVTVDFGANITLTGGISFQSLESWLQFIHKEANEVSFQTNNAELYFEEADLDGFIQKIEAMDIQWVHTLKTHDWGQRGIRIYDPDGHILEISETMQAVTKRFQEQGMSVREIAERMLVSEKIVTRWLK